MFPWLRRFGYDLLYDEAAAQRYLAVSCYMIGKTLSTGGVVPIVEIVIPGLDWFYRFGPVFIAAAFFLGAGSMLPSLTRNGRQGMLTGFPFVPPSADSEIKETVQVIRRRRKQKRRQP